MKKTLIEGRFQQYPNFAFLIPHDRDAYGGDFFVPKKLYNWARDRDNVVGELLPNTTGKKPEVKIVEIIKPEKKEDKIIEWIYSGWDGNFGFIDIPGQEKGIFVYGRKKWEAQEGDRVKAKVQMYNGKEEAIVTEVLGSSQEKFTGIYIDNDKFGFVEPDEGEQDIFIAGSRKAGARAGDYVEWVIIKNDGRRPEGVIKKIL